MSTFLFPIQISASRTDLKYDFPSILQENKKWRRRGERGKDDQGRRKVTKTMTNHPDMLTDKVHFFNILSLSTFWKSFYVYVNVQNVSKDYATCVILICRDQKLSQWNIMPDQLIKIVKELNDVTSVFRSLETHIEDGTIFPHDLAKERWNNSEHFHKNTPTRHYFLATLEPESSNISSFTLNKRSYCSWIFILKAMRSLGLNPSEQEVIDIPNYIMKKGFIYFSDFCQLVLGRVQNGNF